MQAGGVAKKPKLDRFCTVLDLCDIKTYCRYHKESQNIEQLSKDIHALALF